MTERHGEGEIEFDMSWTKNSDGQGQKTPWLGIDCGVPGLVVAQELFFPRNRLPPAARKRIWNVYHLATGLPLNRMPKGLTKTKALKVAKLVGPCADWTQGRDSILSLGQGLYDAVYHVYRSVV